MFIHKSLISRRGFTLIELIIGMAIFAIGMTGILALLYGTIENSFVSRHEIVASNLLREEVELVKNIRNTNVRSYVDWDKNRVDTTPSSFTGWVFLIENNFSEATTVYNPTTGNIEKSPVFIRNISSLFPLTNPSDLAWRFTSSRLYTDVQWRFTHESLSNTGTAYASYLIISPMKFDANGTIEPKDPITQRNQGYILDARVIVSSRWAYREYDLKTIITDWKK